MGVRSTGKYPRLIPVPPISDEPWLGGREERGTGGVTRGERIGKEKGGGGAGFTPDLVDNARDASPSYPLDMLSQSQINLASPFPSTSFLGMPLINMFSPLSYLPVFNGDVNMLHQLSQCRRKRRHRTIFTDEQLGILEHNFAINQYPDMTLREKLALQCDLKEERVEIWFKNRRAKERKKGKEGPNGISLEQSPNSEENTIINEESDYDEYEPRAVKRTYDQIDEDSLCSKRRKSK
ncbi:unnamed protein product [Bursaphelenchus okinawaensis]|uniref:Homeobox domain-containing protein n=1 Tax=Bursaphelenchus okinawaensis TaxID=465554 RepID=A0A811JVF8_9BILA|nr:unnamed protein product [Bursaphelenchus okinawaensis]CAG9084393.1 unnamed protein product [Bursaphelenchus okinawaensis]